MHTLFCILVMVQSLFGDNRSLRFSVRRLRLDPVEWYDTPFGVKSIEFLQELPENETLWCDSLPVNTELPADVHADRVLFPFNPESGICYMLNGFYTWDKRNQKLIVNANHRTLAHTVGSDRFLCDGNERELGYSLYLKDGLPMLDMQLLAECLGYGFETNGQAFRIITKS